MNQKPHRSSEVSHMTLNIYEALEVKRTTITTVPIGLFVCSNARGEAIMSKLRIIRFSLLAKLLDLEEHY